jgi:hypothetical protein
MRHAFAAAALLCSTPAFATGGFECRPMAGSGPSLHVGIGHGISLRPFAVWLREGSHVRSTSQSEGDGLALGQSWIDGQYLWLDVLDRNATRFEAKLRATFQPKLKGRPAIGTLARNGRTWRVRCEEA